MSEPIRLDVPPGIVKTLSDLAAGLRYVDGDKVRFVNGKPQKVGGWIKLVPDQFEGICRGVRLFQDSNRNQDHAFGTNERAYLLETADKLHNITPYRITGQLTNPFSTTSGSAIVNVAHVSHGITQIGDVVYFQNATAVGGITIDGEYQVTDIVDADNYQITHSAAAASTAGPGGGTVDYQYEIPKGLKDAALFAGYGVGRYGEETYGTPRTLSSIQLEPRIWTIDEYGMSAVACYNDSIIYTLSWPANSRMQPLANSPKCRTLVVTSERFILALGAVPLGETDVDPMVVRWPDRDDPTDWTPTLTNTANQRRLQIGKRIMGGVSLSNYMTLIWTDTALYTLRYTGSAFIYDSPTAGVESGLVGQMAFIAIDDYAYWMSAEGFRMYAGQIRPIPNEEDIRTWVLDNLTKTQIQKCTCGYIAKYREVVFTFPGRDPVDTGLFEEEPNTYVAVNIDNWTWTVGTGGRTSIEKFRTDDSSVVMFGDDRYIYHHEKDASIVDDDGAAMDSYITSGLFNVNQGRRLLNIDGYVPDNEKQIGDMTLIVLAKDNPRSPDAMTQTKTITETTELVDLRLNGRLMQFTLRSNVIGGYYEIGVPQIEVKPGGLRR